MDRIKRNRNLVCGIMAVVLAIVTFAYGWTYTYDTDTPAYDETISLGDDKIREAKDAVQERLNVDHVFTLTGSEVSNADSGKADQITFTDLDTSLVADGGSDDTHTPAANEGILDIKDISSTRELCFWDEASNVVQITSGGLLYLAGTYANELALTNTGNTVNTDNLVCTAAGILTLPTDSTDTTEANLRYNDTDDTVEYRNTSAWAALALASANESACSGTAQGDNSDMSVDVGFAPGFIFAWNQQSGDSLWWWTETDSSANYTLGGSAGVNRETTMRIEVSSTTITFKNDPGAGEYVNSSGITYHYIALSLTAGGKNPT